MLKAGVALNVMREILEAKKNYRRSSFLRETGRKDENGFLI